MTTGLLPTFMLIGAPKAGSTSLFEYLGQHPDVHTSRLKEPRYFAFDGQRPPGLEGATWVVDTWDDYLALFADARPDQARGEASVVYLHSAGVIERVQAQVPDVRLLVILRHPVEAIWSHYLMARALQQETRPIEQMIEEEPLEPRSVPWTFDHDNLIRSRFYHHHLCRWLDAFAPEQLVVLLHDDLVVDADTVVRRAWEHIGVDPGAPLDVTQRHNEGVEARSWWLHGFTHRPGRVGTVVKSTLRHVPGRAAVQARIRRWNEQPPTPVPAGTRARLLAILRDDTEALEQLLDRDLSAWKR